VHVCLLASGSKGNALYLKQGESALLVDAGLSGRELRRRLETIGADELHGMMVSHEHHDHVQGIGPLSRRENLPVFMHGETCRALSKVGVLDDHREIGPGERFAFRDLEVDPFPISHDAAVPMGFVVSGDEGKIGVATDLGVATRLVTECLRGCRVLVLEFNHDEEMLRDGPYPWHLKQRIRSRQGHLENRAAGSLLREVAWEGLEAVFLAHLSETNNRPELALAAAEQALEAVPHCRPQLIVGSQQVASKSFLTL